MMWTRLFGLDGREIGVFSTLHELRGRVVEQCDCRSEEDVTIDDRYDADGDFVEFVVVDGIGDVGTLDRVVPEGWRAVIG